MEDLGMGDIFHQSAEFPRGLVPVRGPTGSSRSTTLAATMDYINDTKYEHILTIEDPIEFVYQSKKCLVNQREVHRDTHGCNEDLRSALREYAHISLVSELRDLETIRGLSLRRRRAIWSLASCIPLTLPRPSTELSMFSPGGQRYGSLHAVWVAAGGHLANPAEKNRQLPCGCP